MKSILYSVTIVIFLAMPTSLFGAKTSNIKELKHQADSVLKQSNVSARKDINIVFDLVDLLLQKGQKKTAEEYLVLGLQHFPWNIEYQMLYAEMLAQNNKLDQAKDRAKIVLQHAETDDLINRARHLLGNKPLPNFDKIGSIPDSKHSVVLIPMQEYDKWLLLRVKEELSNMLGISVYIRNVNTSYPKFSRDRRSVILNYIRRQIKEEIKNPEIIQILQSLGLKEQDIDEDLNIIKISKHFMHKDNPGNIKLFMKYLDDSKGKDPQWDVNQLNVVLSQAIKDYRRRNIAYLGVTSNDIYANDYNFLFGQASRQGGVISYHRFTAAFNNEIPNQERLIKRTVMQALASIGHIYGVGRCTNPTCARAYPHSLSEHDAKAGTLCKACERGFQSILKKTPSTTK
jgi:predicted Zn-dependent protease